MPKTMIQRSVEQVNIDPESWETIAENQPSWYRTIREGGGETFESNLQHEEDLQCAVRRADTSSRVHQTHSSVTPGHNSSGEKWAFIAISTTAKERK